ncbi:hypothetical protein TEA_023462 [Camellia sinensis var. sinensis]|uniref:GED domain-containing protein n=1 Tax=Camellia sinensis var. sinensis TaxID=542762 RepID=A0A4S4F196_CAMSN|nr:hypothetical protein TEA_023462 [Camellia sinensis var. sinensis]
MASHSQQSSNIIDIEENSLEFVPTSLSSLAIEDPTPLSSVSADYLITPSADAPPLTSSYNHRIRPLLDAVDKLRHLKVAEEGIQLPTIINEKSKSDLSELSRMPQKLSSVAEAMTAFMRIIGLSMESLRKILSRGEFDEYPDDKNMHCTVRLAEMLNEYSEELQKSDGNKSTENFLMDEIRVLDETKGIWLPNFLPRAAFLIILRGKVKEMANTPVDFVAKVWNYIESVVIRVLMHHCDSYPQLMSSTRRAAQNLIAKMKEKSFDRAMELVEMEKLADYTCSPEYMTEWAKLMAHQNAFRDVMNNHYMSPQTTIEGFGKIEVGHLRLYSSTREQAFDLKMRITAYWKIVLRRFIDNLALHLLLSINELVNRNMQTDIVKEVMGSHGGHGIERMLEEPPPVAMKRERLNKSIRLLKQSKGVVAQIMDRITVNVD